MQRMGVVGVARFALGGLFVLFGLNYFIPMFPMPTPDVSGSPIMIYVSKLLGLVKVLEIIGGVLLFSANSAPFGLTILVPIIININIFDLLVLQHINPAGISVTVLGIFLVYSYRHHFPKLYSPISPKKKNLS